MAEWKTVRVRVETMKLVAGAIGCGESATAFVEAAIVGELERRAGGAARPAAGPTRLVAPPGARRPVHAPQCRCAVCVAAKGKGKGGSRAAGG